MGNIIIVAHNAGSVQRLIDVARVAYAFDEVKLLVATKPYGAAAQSGVPEVQKMALKRGKGFMVLPGIEDAAELLKPQRIYTVSWDYGERVEPGSIELNDAMIIVGLTDPGLSKQEAGIGTPIYPSGTSTPVGPAAELALLLYEAHRG